MTPRWGNTSLFCFSKKLPSLSLGSLKGAKSAQKALQGSETETRELLGRTEENGVSPMRGHWFALQANQWFFTKKGNRKKWVSGQTCWRKLWLFRVQRSRMGTENRKKYVFNFSNFDFDCMYAIKEGSNACFVKRKIMTCPINKVRGLKSTP